MASIAILSDKLPEVGHPPFDSMTSPGLGGSEKFSPHQAESAPYVLALQRGADGGTISTARSGWAMNCQATSTIWLSNVGKTSHKPRIFGNGNHTTYKGGDDWGMVYGIVLATSEVRKELLGAVAMYCSLLNVEPRSY